ncbi:hypothetical protein KJR09_04855 [Streptococcus lutetiensis]|nr:hypothetical protein [Streptococcus lutetiensis]
MQESRYNVDLNQNIQSKLALRIAQLELDNATLQAQIEQLQQQNAELQQQLEEATAPETQNKGE